MTRLTRFGLAAALAVVLTPTARAADLDRLLPAEADTVMYVNVKQILGSEVVKKYALEQIKQALDGNDAKKVLGELGLDPLKDIDRVVLGSAGTDPNDMKFLVIVHGTFDPEKLYKAAEVQSKKNPDQFSMIKDGKTVMFKFQSDKGNPVYATVIDDKTVIASSEKKLIGNALAAAADQKPAAVKADLAALVKKQDEKASVFAVSVVKGKFDNLKLPAGGQIPIDLSGLEKVLPKTETMSVVVKVAADVTLEVVLGMKDEDSAGDMRNVLDELLKAVKPLAQFAGAADPRAKPLGDILSTVKTTTKNKEVTVTGKVTGTNIGKMINPND